MRASDLDHKELLELDPDGGVVRFAGQRALLIDAVAMGLLRKYLVENFGLNAARAVLTQFGFAHGWRMVEAMRAEFNWSSDNDLLLAGPRICALEGLFRVDAGCSDPLSKRGVVLLASYEAEQHLLHFGRADEAVCWTICGLMSGYVSAASGREIYVLEQSCQGCGHATCHLFGRTRDEWGDERAEELRFFEPGRLKECLDVSLQRVLETLMKAEKKIRAHRRTLVHVTQDENQSLGVIAKGRAMQQLVDLVRRVAKVDTTILITGESGTGKERIARLLHDESERADGPFIAVSCGAIAEPLLESELFGHARGAFTGATQDRVGLFEAANGGTLLLDEIGEVSPGMQVKLLRVLQEREVRRVGENKNRSINVRVLAATNRDLTRAVAEDHFRQDLYYRLKVVELRVPPLRKRRDDILALARVLLEDVATRLERNVSSLSPAAAEQLLRYDWPGNVRELENAVECAVALARTKRVELGDLPEEVRRSFAAPVATAGTVRPLKEVERDYIIAALELNRGNQTNTADQLEIGSATLYRKLKSYGMIGDRNPSRPPSALPEDYRIEDPSGSSRSG